MSEPAPPAWKDRRNLILVGAAAAAAIAGGFIGRGLAPATTANPGGAPRRPIIQFVRPQSALPSLADNIDRLCPSVAAIVPHNANPIPSPPLKLTSKSAKSAAAAATAAPPVPPQGVLISNDG